MGSKGRRFRCGKTAGSSTLRRVAACLALLLLGGLATACDGSQKPGTSPVPNVTLTAPSSAPSPPAKHELSKGEAQALAHAATILSHPSDSEQKERFMGFTAEGAEIVGYLVEARAPGLMIAFLVDLDTGRARLAGIQYGVDPWSLNAPEGGGEEWAVSAADHALQPLLEQFKLRLGNLERGISGYIVGWPTEGELTMWLDGKGVLRGGTAAP